MPTLHIEHEVGDYDSWKRVAFDVDPIGRAKSGVRRHRISRSVDDPNFVIIELELETKSEAEVMLAALQNLWRNPLARIGAPTARIVEIVDTKEY